MLQKSAGLLTSNLALLKLNKGRLVIFHDPSFASRPGGLNLMKKKYLHGVCRKCFKIYRNVVENPDKNSVENLRIFTCGKCVCEEMLKKCPNLKLQLPISWYWLLVGFLAVLPKQ